jgi:sugar phosphate isomerase/epimerase
MNRRDFLHKSAFAALAMSLPATPNFFKEMQMGVVVHSFASRWNPKEESQKYPGFTNAIQLIEHCHQIGAGGVQVGVNQWTNSFARKVRDKREKLGMYLEGSIALPKKPENVAMFEQEVKYAREAGVQVLRTVSLGGRRYESFSSAEQYKNFVKKAVSALEMAEPVLRKHKIKLGVENHKDWLATELVQVLQQINSEWIGVTLDFGNSIALLEDPMEVVKTLLPYTFTTHVKDMAVEEYQDGFLLSEVPLGNGILNIPKIVELCKIQNPAITFNLEMITRDPLEIPCLKEDYWTTLGGIPGSQLAQTLRMVRQHKHPSGLPRYSQLSIDERLAAEEENIRLCLDYSKDRLGLK